MNLKINYALALFTVFLIVSLTPAFAVQMGDVANDAKNYEIDSHKKRGFFAKITFLAKGFKLVKTAQNAQKNSNYQESDKKANTYDSILDNTVNSFCQAHNMLNFRNSRAKTIQTLKTQKTRSVGMINEINDPQNLTNATNKTNNSTNTANNTKNSMCTVNNSTQNFEIPNNCKIDARLIRDQLEMQGINTFISIQQEITKALEGKIVQIIDDKGYLRYVTVDKISDSQVTVITNNNCTKNMSLDEFKANYTGIILETSSGEGIIDNILEVQKLLLQKQKTMATDLKDDAKGKIILWSLLAGVAILLIIIGALIGIFFAKVIANDVTAQATARVESTCYETCMTLSNEASSLEGNSAVFGNFEGTLYTVTATEGYMSGEGITASAAATASLGMGVPIASLTSIGLLVVPIIGIELVSNVMLQNWIKVILGSVGLILVIMGLALAITSVIFIIENVGKFIIMSQCYNQIVNENKALDDWVKIEESNNITDNSSKYIRKNNTLLNNTNTELNLNRGIIPSSF